MAITVRKTRSSSKRITTTTAVAVEKEFKIKSVSLDKPKKERSVKVIKKSIFEDSLKHIEIPSNLELPQKFIEFHSPSFIEGLNFILKKDPSLYPTIVHSNFNHFAKEVEKAGDVGEKDPVLGYWSSLVNSIVSQQISGSAAHSIRSRFYALFDGNPTPSKVLEASSERLRLAGLSNQKVKYVYSLCEAFTESNSKLARDSFFKNSSTDEIIEELVRIKGIGVWSAKMFLAFELKKIDIFASDDLGIARGASNYLKKRPHILQLLKTNVSENPILKKMLARKSKFKDSKGRRDWIPYHDAYVESLGEYFSPYKSVLMLILWRISSTNVQALEN